jgi:hypothetical protein
MGGVLFTLWLTKKFGENDKSTTEVKETMVKLINDQNTKLNELGHDIKSINEKLDARFTKTDFYKWAMELQRLNGERIVLPKSDFL